MSSSGVTPPNYEVRPAVRHGANANTARPATSAVVEWYGTVRPLNAAAQDVYWNEQADLPERYDGAAWHVQGAAAYAPVSAPRQFNSPTPPAMAFPANISGHGWADGGSTGATLSLNDTTGPPGGFPSSLPFGTQAVKITTNGTQGAARITKTLGSAIDMTGKQPVIWVYVDDVTKLAASGSNPGIGLYYGDSTLTNWTRFDFESNQAASFNDRYLRSGHWHRMTAGWVAGATGGTPARNAIIRAQVTIFDNNTGPVNVWIAGAGWQPEPVTQWPNGVVSFTFDDCFTDHWVTAMPKLAQYGYPATEFVIVDTLGQAGYLTLSQLQQLRDMHGWEIAAHAYTQADHNAAQGFNSLSQADLTADLAQMKAWMLANGFQDGADHFAYPQGFYNDQVVTTARQFFTAVRSQHSYKRETTNPGEPLRIRTFNLGQAQTLAQAQAIVDEAYTNREWAIFTFHQLTAGAPASGIQWLASDFRSLVDYVAAKGTGAAAMPVRTFGDVLRRVV